MSGRHEQPTGYTPPTPGTLDRAALRALADAATEGPWEVEPAGRASHSVVANDGTFVCDLEDGYSDNGLTDQEYPAQPDAEFIAAARTAVPELLDALDEVTRAYELMYEQFVAAQAEVQRLRKGIEAQHREAYPGAGWCAGCHDSSAREAWPCPSVALLDGAR